MAKVPWFDGYPIQVLCGTPGKRGRLTFYYGGKGMARGDGCGCVISNDGVHVDSWQLPAHEGGKYVRSGGTIDIDYREAPSQEGYDEIIKANSR
jgi:hypothetical protein